MPVDLSLLDAYVDGTIPLYELRVRSRPRQATDALASEDGTDGCLITQTSIALRTPDVGDNADGPPAIPLPMVP
jgi:hypothetical protein